MTPSEDWGRSLSVRGSLLGQLHAKPPLGHDSWACAVEQLLQDSRAHAIQLPPGRGAGGPRHDRPSPRCCP